MHKQIYLFLIFTLLITLNATSQENDSISQEVYKTYSTEPREVAYVHLNKSTYIKGEDIGFTAYILNRDSKKPSLITTNLYVSLEDENNNVLVKKLLKLENGFASSVIELDSTFTSGTYTFKAYTNWMLNFKEQDYFVENIKIIDPKIDKTIESKAITNSIDVQFLPESGHLINNITTTIGVIIKDSKGFGVPDLVGQLYDKNQTLITEFKVNHLGIGRFPLLAELGNDYIIKINYLNKEFNYNLNENIEPLGISLSVLNHRNLAVAVLKTNKESLEYIANKPYTLKVYNNNKFIQEDVVFLDQTAINKAFDLNDLPSGINMFILFDENNEPIAERLFFNYTGIEVLKTQDIVAKKQNDSISLNLSYTNFDPNENNQISISVLPQETASYRRHHNIISYNFLQPYIKGDIEQAKYYFTNITDKTKYDLDNLLITRGWSSYDWTIKQKNTIDVIFPFERGINIKGNVNKETSSSERTYMVQGLDNQAPQFIKLRINQKAFLLQGLFITDSVSISISEVKKNGTLAPSKLYLQAFPSQIPYLRTNTSLLKPKENYRSLSYLDTTSLIMNSISNVQKLDQIVLNKKIDKDIIRSRELSAGRFGKVKVVSDEDRGRYRTLQDYLVTQGVYTDGRDQRSGTNFYTGRGRGSSNNTMTVFLNGIPIAGSQQKMLAAFPMDNVDFVEINTSGIGEGFRGSGGVLKIYTNPKIPKKNTGITGQSYDVPLTFSKNKKFYIPKYKFYYDDFFKNFGVIDWKPQLSINADGIVNLKIAEPEIPFTLFIEGITESGSFIFEEKSIDLN